MQNSFLNLYRIIAIFLFIGAAAHSLNGQQCSNGTNLRCGSEFTLPQEGTYRFQFDIIPGTSEYSQYDFYLYMYSTQTATVKVYEKVNNKDCKSFDIGDETYTGECPPMDPVSTITFSQEFLATCQPTTYYIEVTMADTCFYDDAYVTLQCSGEVVECLDCNSASTLECGTTVVNIGNNKATNVSDYCDQKNTGYTGGERVYKITPEISQEFTFVLSGVDDGDNLDMFLLSSCDETRDCLATSAGNPSSDTDEITHKLEANETYYLVVDTDMTGGGGESDFTLRVTGCCTSLEQTDNNFLFIPTGENTAALKFNEDGNSSAMGAKNIRWTLRNDEIGQGSTVEVSIDSEKLDRLCVKWDVEEAGFDYCYTQCKDICFPIDYACNLISYLPIVDLPTEYQFAIPDEFFVISWLLHDGQNEIEFRDDDIGNKIVFNHVIEPGTTYDVTVVYREDDRSGCFMVCSRKFCFDEIHDFLNTSEAKIQPVFVGSREDIENSGIYQYQLNYELPTDAQFVKWEYYPVNKSDDVTIVEGGFDFINLDANKGNEYTICMIFEKDGCLQITCSDICLDSPYDVCINNAPAACSPDDIFVVTEPQCDKGQVEVSVSLPENAILLYWSDDQGEIIQSNSTTIAVSSKGSNNSDQFVICYYRICFIGEGSTFNNDGSPCCIFAKYIPIPYCPGNMSCGSTISRTLMNRPNDWTIESLNFSDECKQGLTPCDFNGPDDIVGFVKTGEYFALRMTQEENGLSLFVLDENFHAVTVEDENGTTLCKGQNVDANGFVVSNAESIGEIFSDIFSPLPKGQYYAVIQGGCQTSFDDDYQLELQCICSAPDNDFDIEFSPDAVSISLFSCESTFPEGTDLRISPRFKDSPSIIEYMELYIDDQLVSRQSSAPYEWGLPNMQPGSYELTLRLVNECGKSKEENCTIVITPEVVETCDSTRFSFKNQVGGLNECSINDRDGVGVEVNGAENIDSMVLETVLGDMSIRKDNAPFFWSAEEIESLASNRDGVQGIDIIVTLYDKCGNVKRDVCYWYKWSKPEDRCPDPEMAETSFTNRDIAITSGSTDCFRTVSEDDFDGGFGAGLSTYNQTPTRHMGAGLNYRFESDNFNDNDSDIDSVATMIEDQISDFNSVGLKWGTTLSGGFEYDVTRSDIFSLYAAYSIGASYELKDDSDLFGIGYSSQSNNFYTDMNIGCYSEELMENVDPGYLGPVETDGFAELHDPDQFALSLMTRFFKAPITKSMQGDTFRLNFKLMIYQNECLSDLWFEYEGDRTIADNCELLYEEGHDLSIKIDGDYLPNIEEISLAFEDQILIDAEAPFEWTDIEKNMSPGTYPITITAITFCNDTIRRACNVVIAADPCDSDFWFVNESGRSEEMNCEMTYQEDQDIWIHLGGSNLHTVQEATLSYKGIELVDKSYPFEWTDYDRNLSPGRYPIRITIIDTSGNEFMRECTIVITDCEMTFNEGHNLSVRAGGDQSDITEASVFFMESTYLDTSSPFEWINVAEDMAIGTYPMSMSITDNCDSITIKNCTIIIQEKTCTSDFWFVYQGERTSTANCVMSYPEGHNLTLSVGYDNMYEINLVTFIYGAQAFVDNSFPYEWVDADTDMTVGSTNVTMIVSTVCGTTIVRECTVVVEPKECYTGYHFDFTSHPSTNNVKAPEGLEEKSIESAQHQQSSTDRTIEILNDEDRSSIDNDLPLKRGLELEQNIPNPFGNTTLIRFYNPVDSEVVLSIVDISGKRVWVDRSYRQKGWHEKSIEIDQLKGAGVYIYELSNGLDVARMKMMSTE